MAQEKINPNVTKSICLLIGLIGISMVGSVTSSPGKVVAVSKITHEELLEKLNKETLDISQVGKLLAQTINKETPKVILEKFSVKDIRNLAIFEKKEDYSYEEFQDRIGMCDQLKPIPNLHAFCENSLGLYVEKYLADVEKDYSSLLTFMNPLAKWRIHKFSEQVARSMGNDASIDPVSAITGLLAKMHSSEKESLASDCKTLLNKLAQSKRHAYTGTDYPNGLEEGWLMKKKYCKHILLVKNN